MASKAHEFGKIHWDDINFQKRKYNEADAYYQSKLANVLHAKELSRRLQGTGITVYSLHPGAVKTELARHSENLWYGFVMKAMRTFYKTPIQGAQTTLYCVLEDSIR